ncbi:MAG TPA: ABC transporter permease subunit [Tissierellaceae bacterium]|nr:ABC transporter permease subunit [Tissierellaceae bacterium]
MNKDQSLTLDITKEELLQMEKKEKSTMQKIIDAIISILPVICGIIALLEYKFIPNIRENENPIIYTYFLVFFIAIYGLFWIYSILQLRKGKNKSFDKLRHKAPLYSVIFLLLAIYDYLTLKTGRLQYPFLPWVNDILNIMITDRVVLAESAISTIILLFYGYFAGVITGLITGVVCGYSDKIRYWIDPIIKILGPIPTATWIPLVMVLASSLFHGSIFIIALGVWFSVTVATMTGISNIDKSYFDAAKTLGANNNQLVFNVAIPHAVPNMIQGMIQGMSSACTALMIAEMLGVESGLGWYIIWAKSWAMYNKMFAAIIIICIIFITVTKILNIIKKKVLRWQEGMVI